MHYKFSVTLASFVCYQIIRHASGSAQVEPFTSLAD